MTLDGRLMYRLVLATDIEGFSRRNTEQQQCAQADLCGVLDAAAAGAGLDRAQWDRQDRGDGELAVLPEGIDIPRVVADIVHGMEASLARLNGAGDRRRPLRARLALHHGTLTDGPLGPVGDAPIVASRLVEVDAGRRHLRTHPGRDVSVIVSASLYHDVISTGFCPMDPADFEAFRVVVKDTSYEGYLYPSGPSEARGVDDPPARPFHAHGRRRLTTAILLPRRPALRQRHQPRPSA